MAGCNCDMGLANTGRPNCVPIQSVTSTLIMVPLFNNDGTRNKLTLTGFTSYNANDFIAYVNQQDESRRWFPLPHFENVELPKAESKFEESNSGRMVFLRQGKRSFSGELWAEDSTPTLLGKLQNNRCVDFGVYIVDVNGNLVGSKGTADYMGDTIDVLYPIPVDNPSFDPKFMFATDSTTQKIMVGFDFDRLFDESTMYMLTAEEANTNFNSLTGLIDVNFTLTPTMGFADVDFDLKFDYGTALNPIKFVGATAADILMTDSTGVLGITALNESPEGSYELVPVVPFVSGQTVTFTIVKIGFIGKLVHTF